MLIAASKITEIITIIHTFSDYYKSLAYLLHQAGISLKE
jgi:hypothetical protein